MLENFLNWISGILWGPIMIYGILIVGLVFSIMTRFAQIRKIKEMFVLMFTGEKSEAGVSSFQALTIALSGRVGTGNIIGTASAIAFGGPGAVFWMWITAFIGASTAYVESTLAQIYKTKKQGVYRGGPAYYMEKGTGKRWFGVMFAIAAILAMAILMPGVQSNAISSAMNNAFNISPWMTGLAIIALLGFVIIGGVKRIANAAQIIVPFMAVAYLLVAIVVIIMNISEVPAVFGLIIRSAFSVDATFGGMIGAAIAWGVKRAIYSNEAGQGSGPHAAAAAEVSHPAKQGLVQAASIYIDTLLVCSATALMILFMGTYNTNVNNAEGELIVEHVPGHNYTEFTQLAVTGAFPGLDNFGAAFVAFALFFFAFTTLMAYYYIAETNVAYLFSGRTEGTVTWILKIVMLASVFYGSVRTSDLAWLLGDIGLGLMVWTNVIGIIVLAKPSFIALKDYEEQRKAGKDPVFDPIKLGIKNADFWVERNKSQNQQENKEK
ncbi:MULTISPECIES: alanine/glycine:cation symporter family protein [Ureibacillus]|jgi:alanine or glycine:cation symporter, AGCS family|uniref:AGCS family alanine or glycine:cation symporter n=1 Tax=Ureibacillus thermosphaericus TaxID=51173 RepID=A0A840PI91_URETH|nr:alanine/glycine:cation symporter family protein [Ureibacillus thermosphaericus]MBB5148135.1 AGCS family alanine or glycine:cation symporter [Ureibacillus thermosphaericus]NKZ30846.1 alanine:cation symporter family protein [Ureibacillus thermosphaericus]